MRTIDNEDVTFQAIDELVDALDGAAADAKESAGEWEEDLPVC